MAEEPSIGPGGLLGNNGFEVKRMLTSLIQRLTADSSGNMPTYYPVFLNLARKRCVVFGGGAVAEGKFPHLLDAGAFVIVISPKATKAIQLAAQEGKLEWLQREYQPGDLESAFLGIAATNKRSVNQEIFREAERLGVLLNVVDDPLMCTFIAPAVVRRSPVTVAISTGGASPALARKLREELTGHPVLEWADLAGVLACARREVKKQRAKVDPQRWQCCITEEVLRLAQADKEEEALDRLLSRLLDGSTLTLCSDVTHCRPNGCQVRPKHAMAPEPSACQEINAEVIPQNISAGDSRVG